MTDLSSRSVLAAIPKARLADLERSFGVALSTSATKEQQVDALLGTGLVRFRELLQQLTQTYNRLEDPDCHHPEIVTLRRLHEETDRAVLDAYGWTDLEAPPYCPTTPAEHQALERFKDKAIDRLFVLNAERAAEDAKSAPKKAAKGAKKPAKKPAKKSKGKKASPQASLDLDDEG